MADSIGFRDGLRVESADEIGVVSKDAVNPTDFPQFIKLPMEMQDKIWRAAARLPRIVEIRFPRLGNDYQVAPRSMQPPAVLRVSSRARSEAQRVYVRYTVDLNHIQPDPAQKYVYCNFEDDIILLGNNATASRIAKVLADVQNIERVAYIIQKPSVHCNSSAPLAVLQALHGKTRGPVDRPVPERSLGCKSLKELFLVVKSKLWELNDGENDCAVSWRKPPHEGRNAGEIALKETYDRHINNVKAGGSLWKYNPDYVKSDEWIGNKAPQFKFVSFTPLNTTNGPVLDELKISKYSFERLERFFTPARVETLNLNTGCSFIFPKYTTRAAQEMNSPPGFAPVELVTHFELGFYGSPMAIEKAKVEIRKLMKVLRQSDFSRLTGNADTVQSCGPLSSELREFMANNTFESYKVWKC